MCRLAYIVVLLLIANTFVGNAQIKKEYLRFGISFGSGTQNRYPYKLKDHTHTVNFYKAQINYSFKQKRRWAYEINLEPSYNVAEHQLINPLVLNTGDGDDFMQLREHFARTQTIREYVLNIGLILRYSINNTLSTYAIGSIGPMIADTATERLAEGFAFSDIFGVGPSFQIGKTRLDFRYSMRHTSNLNFQRPNKGHNTMNLEYSVLFNL